MVAASLKRAGGSPTAQWRRMQQIMSAPTLPSDLKR